MDALELLQTRLSSPSLAGPGPTEAQLEAMLRAALRAPDHCCLKPYRFLSIEGGRRVELGELFLEATLSDEPDLIEARREKVLAMPLRAPLVLVVIATLCEHPKVPAVEQRVTAGCAAHALELAAAAQGLGAMWRTGSLAYHPRVKAGLGLGSDEEIIGFLYLGTPANSSKKLPQEDPAAKLDVWQGAER
ncbi:nitroreductase family protein [Motiliproteus sp. SC1-56]|uniref:nitroreductase family protein n=1 Tax=Motiliproteus sp. SC1-56 TaxID=2799565 RepID=UPI001A8D16BF|nr:nitroreductase family protein [Motiliproteus sp. SC1-56]